MGATIRVNIVPDKTSYGDIIIAMLSSQDYHGFEEDGTTIVAFIKEELFGEAILKETLSQFSKHYTWMVIPYQNWNAIWESEYEPVLIEDFVHVRAIFHPVITSAKYDIIITPKMSFGTAHHATTVLMIRQMQDIDCSNKQVLDFGTGTGILAILAAKLGAEIVVAIDIDNHSIENAKENVLVNHIENVVLQQRDSVEESGKFDIVLANINLHIIMQNLEAMSEILNESGVLVLSGFLLQDEEILLHKSRELGLVLKKKVEKDGWCCLKLQRHI